ncbi:nonribosomal peptide synthetase MxaA [Methyloversatilis sp.]|uniref:nonribosomal peptide synthetase MxaA n=1 Tax=Methyloversatilis sp. TaxID=2569862 RepID=UPI002732D6AB|nr:nonribosomal peptide synthetase MxaA [Methyloversatilis sp.]MDP2868315.1 nonribosomal peptide synthetase MxaA [Methyloversatilis sp.]MDP3289280.1 nonribosomal peptide synthetase MxaA [Methyloversatilis sp.]MDP3454027.1 nonribosomal peptide synthetase MxaA [Methyloversatilis sp.]MDP3578013.1 nonribosomal peptide synthetase MxaA [Methyloversatilis sp.]
MQPTYWRLRLLSLGAALALLTLGPCHAQDAAAPAQAAARETVQDAPPAAPQAAALSIAPDVQPLRPFGHVIGDVITQRVALDHEGRPLDPEAFPELERVGNWFQRRDVRIERDAAGRRWLVIDYQIINVPDELRALDLPALDLPTKTPGVRLETGVLPVTVAPLTPTIVLARAGLEEMRPDAEAPRIDTASLERRLHFALYAAAALAAAWLALYVLRQLRARNSLPFTRATRDMRHLDPGSTAIWQRLHRALDETAGHVVRGHNLASLLARAPWLAPLQSELERFFEASQKRFFADHPVDGQEPAALCARVARLERQALA